MALPDSSAVMAAIIARLRGDATLMGLMPDGVYRDVASSGKTRFVIVSLITHFDNYAQCRPVAEDGLYLVKAVELNTSPAASIAAADRIHELLQETPMTATGYASMMVRRSTVVAITEVDEENRDIRWQHMGGHYEFFVSPN